jgi:drug/metabolite transporter (DMT)-like permease
MAALLPFLVGTGVALGLGMPIARWLAPHGLQPLTFALWPTAMAGLLLAGWAFAFQGVRPRAELLRFAAVAGSMGYALPMTAAFWLAAHAGAGFAAVAFTLPPLFTWAMNLLVGREPWRPLRGLAIVVGVAGALAMVGHSEAATAGDHAVLALLFLIPALIGGTNVYRSIHLPAGTPAPALGGWTLLAASAVLRVVAAATGALAVPWTATVLLGLGAQAAALLVGYILYFELQKRADAVVFSFMGYVTMVTGIAAGALLLDEPLRWSMLPGLLLVLAGIRMVAR